MVGRKSRRAQRSPRCRVIRAGFEPCVRFPSAGWDRMLGSSKPNWCRFHAAAQIRRVFNGISLPHAGRAEIFALPYRTSLAAASRTDNTFNSLMRRAFRRGSIPLAKARIAEALLNITECQMLNPNIKTPAIQSPFGIKIMCQLR